MARRTVTRVRVLLRLTAALCFFAVASPLVPAASAYRVLAIEYIPGKSHWNFMRAILHALLDHGHAVTVFTPFPDGGHRENYTEVDLSADVPAKVAMDATGVLNTYGRTSVMIPLVMQLSRAFCTIVNGKGLMRDILRDGRNGSHGFDAVLAETAASECASYVAAELGLPLIYAIPSPMVTYIEPAVLGHVPNPATVSHMMAGHAVPGTFARRFSNLVLSAYSAYVLAREETKLRSLDPQPYDLVTPVKPSVVFLNTHHATDAPRPMPPGVIQVGGIHLLNQPKNDLPDDILEFIEGSPHGVIYFTFGSVVMMSTLPDHIHNAFKEALAKVPQRVLWKYEGEMKDKPANVMTSKWFPQRDILLHPNVKLFISHGGISGVYEAVDGGVPVLGFPLFYDQPRNIDNLVEAGMAISMDLLTVEKELFLKNVLELINNANYTKNAKIASERFKDRPMSPAQSVVYWTEYVIRHKGAPHLSPYAHKLTWYQYFLLDIIATVLISIFLVLFIVFKIFKTIRLIFSKRQRTSKTKSE